MCDAEEMMMGTMMSGASPGGSMSDPVDSISSGGTAGNTGTDGTAGTAGSNSTTGTITSFFTYRPTYPHTSSNNVVNQ